MSQPQSPWATIIARVVTDSRGSDIHGQRCSIMYGMVNRMLELSICGMVNSLALYNVKNEESNGEYDKINENNS